MKTLKMLCRRGISMLIVLVMCTGILQVTAFAAEVDEPADGGESGMVSITMHDDKTTVAVNGNVVAENISLTDPDVPAADQTHAKEEAPQVESLPELPEDGVQVDVETGRTENVTVRPDDVPENAEENEDGSYTWTETVTEASGPMTTPCEDLPTEEELADRPHKTLSAEDIKDQDGNVIGQKVVEEYTLADGTVYRKASETYGPADGVLDETRSETQATQTTTTEATTQTTTVKPGSVKVEMSAGSSTNTNVNVTGATVVVKNSNNSDGGYMADVTLKLSGELNADGVTISVTGPGGTPYQATLNQVDQNGNYTLTGIHVDGLSGKGDETITLTLTGEQIRAITANTLKNTLGTANKDNSGAGNKPIDEAAIQAGIDNGKWLSEFHYSDGKNYLGDAGNFSVFAKVFSWHNHTNANVAVGELKTTDYIGIGTDKSPAGSTENTYDRKDLCYIGSLGDSGILDMNNTHSYLILGSGITVGEKTNQYQYTLTQGSNTVEKRNGEIAGILTAEGDAKINFDRAFTELAEYAVALQDKTTAGKSEEATAAAQKIGEVMESLSISDHCKIDCTTLPQDEDGTYLVTISVSDLGIDREINLENFGGNKVLVNVTGCVNNETYEIYRNIKLDGQANEWNPKNGDVLFNFGNSKSTLNFQKQWFGSVLAPNSTVNVGPTFNGKIIADTVSGSSEQHDCSDNWAPEPDTPITPEPEPEQAELVVTLKVTVNTGEKAVETDGGDISAVIESITTKYNNPKPEEPKPTPETPQKPDPDPDPDPRPDPDPDPDDPVVDIPDDPTPLTDTPNDPGPEDLLDIPDEDVPLADIPDEAVPLADVPATGDASGLWYALVMMSAFGLLALSFTGKRRKERV